MTYNTPEVNSGARKGPTVPFPLVIPVGCVSVKLHEIIYVGIRKREFPTQLIIKRILFALHMHK